MTMTRQIRTIRDRNCIAYLLANGFNCDFIPRPDGGLDAEFKWSASLDVACTDYMGNKGVPVQSFVAACRHIGELIRDHRQHQGVR